MRKLFLLLLLVTLGFCCISNICLAEGKLTATSKNVIIYLGKDSGIFVGKVENTGDEPIYYDNGKLVIFSEDDEILEAADYISSSPDSILLQPGDYTYVYEFLWSDPLKNAKIGDVKFSVSSNTRGDIYDQIPATGEIEITEEKYSSSYVNVTFTNTTDEILYGAYVVCAMLDSEDQVIFVNRDRYNSLGVHPGSTVTLKMYIDSDITNYYQANNIKPAKVDAHVYVYTSN